MEACLSFFEKKKSFLYSFVAGTVATPKQALLKALTKKYRTGHHCERSLKFEPAHKRTSQRDDSIMYTAGYKFYKVIFFSFMRVWRKHDSNKIITDYQHG
jgi:hypothetical protein